MHTNVKAFFMLTRVQAMFSNRLGQANATEHSSEAAVLGSISSADASLLRSCSGGDMMAPPPLDLKPGERPSAAQCSR